MLVSKDIQSSGSGFFCKKKKMVTVGLPTLLIIKMEQNKSICSGWTKPKINILVELKRIARHDKKNQFSLII